MAQIQHLPHKKLISFFLLVLVAIGLSIVFSVHAPTETPKTAAMKVPAAGEITVQGMILCLPHKNTDGPQTMECAYGVKDNQGKYYSLHDTDPTYKNISGVPTNVSVSVKGTFTPKEDTKYPTIGVIDVTSITQN